MKDLMTTIAKLDSNGVQVLPEGRSKATSPLVHSSTDMSAATDGAFMLFIFCFEREKMTCRGLFNN